MVLFDIAAKRVVFGGHRFINMIVTVGAAGSIMCEVDTTTVSELILLSPCLGAGSGAVTSDDTPVEGAWESRGWADWCNGGLAMSGRHCCYLLDELLEEDVGC